MRIRISDLPLEGLTVAETIPLEPLNARLLEGQGSDIRFTTPPEVHIRISRTPDGAETKGTVSSKYLQPCGRCALEIERDLTVDFNFILKPKPVASQVRNTGEFDDDLGILFFEGEHIDLESTVQESLIVALSQFWSPPIDAEGRCTKCGKKADISVVSIGGKASLGELLKKAGVS